MTVQAMVFGNMGDTSGTGVCFTRNPSTVGPRQHHQTCVVSSSLGRSLTTKSNAFCQPLVLETKCGVTATERPQERVGVHVPPSITPVYPTALLS